MEHDMKFNRLMILFAATFAVLCGSGFAADTEDRGRLDQYQEDLEERDWDALRSYLRSRRDEEREETKSALLLSGDVRVDWRRKKEVYHGINLWGGDAVDFKGIRRGMNRFDAEAHLRLDYDIKKSWATIELQYDNKAGFDDEVNCIDSNHHGDKACYCEEMHGSGTCGDFCLKQAWFGYNIYSCDDTEFDIEIGRRNLYHVFDSKVQFLSRFDGILLSYDSTLEGMFDYYAHVAGFVVDYKVNHFAWVAEFGMMNLYDKGLDFKYSIIDWRKQGHNRCSDKVPGCSDCNVRDPIGTQFVVSQWTTGYSMKKEQVSCLTGGYLCKPVRFFGAFLINTDAPHFKFENEETGTHAYLNDANKAWYAAMRVGDVKKAGDWAFQMMYQYVEAFAVPDLDMSGIGNGNVYDDLLITDGTGNTNFKGWRFDGMYAFTDEITINARYEWSHQINPVFSHFGHHYYSQFKMEAIYAF